MSSVPQRSPLRYPGGKTWLIPHVRAWLGSTSPEVLIEPFAGGAVVSLTAVMEDMVRAAVMVEMDGDVAAFWRAALEHNADLCRHIQAFEPTAEELKRIEGAKPRTQSEHGFRTLVLNRTRHGGILAPHASFLRRGQEDKGVFSRWYPGTLVRRLRVIGHVASRITFCEGDALCKLPVLVGEHGRDAAYFVDPPYSAKGGKKAAERLYAHSDIDHRRLFALLAEHECNFLMTYDGADEILNLVREHGFAGAWVSMQNTHHNEVRELLITARPLFA